MTLGQIAYEYAEVTLSPYINDRYSVDQVKHLVRTAFLEGAIAALKNEVKEQKKALSSNKME